MDCEIRDELALRFMLAADEDADALGEWRRAMTATQREGAATRIRRVREHSLYCLKEVNRHSEEHGCGLPDLPYLPHLPDLSPPAVILPQAAICVVEPKAWAPEPVPTGLTLPRLPAYAWGVIAGCVLGLVIALASS